MEYLGWLVFGMLLGAGCAYFIVFKSRAQSDKSSVSWLLKAHFHPTPTANIVISGRRFPYRMRADLQGAFERLFANEMTVHHFSGVRMVYGQEISSLTDCIIANQHNPAATVPPEYEDIDIGGDQKVRALKIGLWLLERSGIRFAVLLTPVGNYCEKTAIQFQIGAPNSAEGAQVAQEFFKSLENAVLKSSSYRGKILSLEQSDHSYSGESTGITVHKLRLVERDQVILPEKTVTLLDRNVIQFAKQRPQLARYQQSTKKGILFYGPPGTGKTHTIHYLARALEGHTTLLISAEQVGLLSEYMTLARLLQPSIVVIEDVDLIARDRSTMNSACEELLLNKLLNEMDGLKEEADILFILTTNRPEALESALASRPGRIDQAIEFPLPDDAGRRKLIVLYAKGTKLSDAIVDQIIRRTHGVSAAFIKELLRRTVQFHIERNGTEEINQLDVDNALDEMLFSGGSLNLKLLGAAQEDNASVEPSSCPACESV